MKRYYKLKILQVTQGEVETELNSIIKGCNGCVDLVKEPIAKSDRSIDLTGRKWINGIISIEESPTLRNCMSAFMDKVTLSDLFSITPKRINNYNLS